MTHRSYYDYTPREDFILTTQAGLRTLDDLAAELGRTPVALYLRLRKLTGESLTTVAARSAGMSVDDVVRGLGVNRSTVREWIARGRLKATRAKANRRRVWTIDVEDFLMFLDTWAGVLTNLYPSPEWAATVRDLRAEAEAKYITTAEIARVSGYTRTAVSTLTRKPGFPPCVVDPGETNGGKRYDRAAVLEWLKNYEPYACLRGRARGGWASRGAPRAR